MWPNEELAKKISEDYVAVLIDVDKDAKTKKQYNVSAMPTLVIATPEGEQQARSVGAPFSTPEDAMEWFAETTKKIKALPELKKAFGDTKHTGVDEAEALAEAYGELGLGSKVAEIWEEVIGALGEGHEKEFDARIKLCEALLTERRPDMDKVNEHLEAAKKLVGEDKARETDVALVDARILMMQRKYTEAATAMEKILPGLIETKDDRAVDLTEHWGNAKSREAGRDKAKFIEAQKALRTKYEGLAKTFAESERIHEIRVKSAITLYYAEEFDKLKEELKTVAEDDAAGKWQKEAKRILEIVEKQGK